MKKRYIKITFKESGRFMVFPTIAKMYTILGEPILCMAKNSLWNALSKGKGRYENNRIKVEYKETKLMLWK